MSVFVSFSMYFLSFVPLWITVLFIDIKSLVDGGGDKWTEIIGITGILLGLLISAIILFTKFYVSDDEKYTLTIQDAKESKTITAEIFCFRIFFHYLRSILRNGMRWLSF